MISQVKNSYAPVISWGIFGLLMTALSLAFSYNNETHVIRNFDLVMSFIPVVFFVGVGFVIRYLLRPLIYKTVKNGVHVSELELDTDYFLNGSVMAIYYGYDPYWARYKFKVVLDPVVGDYIYIDLAPGEVTDYISTKEEK